MATDRTGLAPARGTRSGAAIIEMVVCLLALIVIIGALLQVTSLGKTQTITLLNARRAAAEQALTSVQNEITLNATLIRDWNDGADKKPYTADDTSTPGDATAFSDKIVEKTSPDGNGWMTLGQAPNDAVISLRGSAAAVSQFGLVEGSDSATVKMLPIVQKLIYAADHIDIKCEVWMTKTGGFY